MPEVTELYREDCRRCHFNGRPTGASWRGRLSSRDRAVLDQLIRADPHGEYERHVEKVMAQFPRCPLCAGRTYVTHTMEIDRLSTELSQYRTKAKDLERQVEDLENQVWAVEGELRTREEVIAELVQVRTGWETVVRIVRDMERGLSDTAELVRWLDDVERWGVEVAASTLR